MNAHRTLRSATLLLSLTIGLKPAHAGLVGHWDFEEGNGTTVADSSGLGHHGVLVNPKPETWTTGRSGGGALYLDGTTGADSTYVTIADSVTLHITGAISFAAWIRCDGIQRDAPILAKEGDGKLCYWFGAFGTGGEGSSPGNFGVLLDTDGNQPWSIYDRNQGALFPGLWMHVASTWDGSTIRHYLNGVLLPQTADFTGLLHVADGALILGANVPYNNTAFQGALDEVRLYDHALTAEEVTALVGVTPQRVGYWTFDEGGGTNVLDHSGLGNHGTIVNPTAATWTSGIRNAALYFDGTVGPEATYVHVPDAPSLHISSAISFSAWVRCDDISRDAPILAKEGEGKLSYWFGAFGLSYRGAGPGNFGLLLSNNGYHPWTLEDRDQGTLPQGEWVHLASTWDGLMVRHYLNGEALPETSTFAGPIRYSDAFLAIGVNSLFTFATNHTAFLGAIDEVSLYNRCLSPEEIRAVYLESAFRITSIAPEGSNLRIAWACIPGRRYVVQTSSRVGTTGQIEWTNLTPVIEVPADFSEATYDYVHAGGLGTGSTLFYRVELLL